MADSYENGIGKKIEVLLRNGNIEGANWPDRQTAVRVATHGLDPSPSMSQGNKGKKRARDGNGAASSAAPPSVRFAMSSERINDEGIDV